MSGKRSLFVRIHARLHDDERGFSLLETVMAITVIFGSLITLAMSASTGFRYVGIGREQQAANQIANQMMEQARGLAFSKVQRGMQSSGLSTDPNLVTSCAGDAAGTYRLYSCAGDLVVTTNLNCPTATTDCATPLVPSSGTIGASDDYPVEYTWRTYVTNNCPAVTATCTDIAPYKVTIIVSWPGAGTSPSGIQGVTIESLYHSPSGCVNPSTHPFAAPCQPFYYGQAIVPVGQIDVEGDVTLVDFEKGTVFTTGAESTLQNEQVSQVQGSWTQSGTALTTSSGTTFGGSTVSRTTAADSDPSGTTPTYSVSTVGNGTASNQFASGGGSWMQVQNAAGDTGQAISATAAGGANVCPPTPPAPPAESDLQPCGGAFARQAAISRVVGHFHGFPVDIGDATIASIANPTNYSTSFVNRMLVSGQDGNVQDTAVRAFGTINIGGLPDLMAAPAGWTGYFLTLSGYGDRVVSTAGTSAAAPTATISAGTLSYWNGTGYTSVNLATTPGYSLSGLQINHNAMVGAVPVTVRIASVGTIAMETQPAVTSTPSGSGSILRNQTQASIGSPVYGELDYEVWVAGVQVVDLVIDIALGTVTSKSVYGAAPTAG
jgi:type II secretory pathway pseudopilin PulG